MKFELTILGSNSATPAHGRNQTSHLLNINEKLYLIDCGEGTQLQLLRFGIKTSKIKYIFISHLHGDHYLGLIGLLSSMHLNGRTEELTVFGPPQLEEIIKLNFKYSDTHLRFPLLFQPTQTAGEEIILRNNDVTVRSFPLDHRIPCTGFRIDENPRLANINIEAVTNLPIPIQYYPELKKGKDYTSEDGIIYKSSELTFPPRPSRSFAFCSDTIDSGNYHASIEGVSLLYHEATFLHDMLPRATETFHTTALQAGLIAKAVKAEKIIIGHFSSRYKNLDSLLLECKSAFPNAYLAIEGSSYLVE